jgi:hypothetical protein
MTIGSTHKCCPECQTVIELQNDQLVEVKAALKNAGTHHPVFQRFFPLNKALMTMIVFNKSEDSKKNSLVELS